MKASYSATPATAFTSPKSAVDAAIAAQQALGLPVRMGIATGEAALRDGDYFGTVLARRLRDQRTPVGVFQVRAPGPRTSFRRCEQWTRVRAICGLRPRASSGASPRPAKCKQR